LKEGIQSNMQKILYLPITQESIVVSGGSAATAVRNTLSIMTHEQPKGTLGNSKKSL